MLKKTWKEIPLYFIGICLWLFLVVLAVLLFTSKAYKMPSYSMMNTMLKGDHFLISKSIYGIKNPFTQKTIIPLERPKREDIIVFQYPENPNLDFIKRVVGVEGDVIEVRNKKLYVNDELVEQEFAIHTDPHIIPAVYNKRDNLGPVVVPPESLFVMGDNRDNSKDSRFWGFVKCSAVKGKAFLIYWSSDNWKIRWNRIGKRIR